MINGLMNQFVDFDGSFIFKGDLHDLESVSQALNANSDGPVSEVGFLSLCHWVIVDIDNLVEVLGDSLADRVKGFVVKFLSIFVHEASKTNGSQVTHGNFIWACVLNDFSAEV